MRWIYMSNIDYISIMVMCMLYMNQSIFVIIYLSCDNESCRSYNTKFSRCVIMENRCFSFVFSGRWSSIVWYKIAVCLYGKYIFEEIISYHMHLALDMISNDSFKIFRKRSGVYESSITSFYSLETTFIIRKTIDRWLYVYASYCNNKLLRLFHISHKAQSCNYGYDVLWAR